MCGLMAKVVAAIRLARAVCLKHRLYFITFICLLINYFCTCTANNYHSTSLRFARARFPPRLRTLSPRQCDLKGRRKTGEARARSRRRGGVVSVARGRRLSLHDFVCRFRQSRKMRVPTAGDELRKRRQSIAAAERAMRAQRNREARKTCQLYV